MQPVLTAHASSPRLVADLLERMVVEQQSVHDGVEPCILLHEGSELLGIPLEYYDTGSTRDDRLPGLASTAATPAYYSGVDVSHRKAHCLDSHTCCELHVLCE